MKEETLNKMRAASLSPDQLADEIKRIDHAKLKATRPSELRCYDRKRAVYAAELAARTGAGETRGSTASPGFPLNRDERPGTLTPDRTWS